MLLHMLPYKNTGHTSESATAAHAEPYQCIQGLQASHQLCLGRSLTFQQYALRHCALPTLRHGNFCTGSLSATHNAAIDQVMMTGHPFGNQAC